MDKPLKSVTYMARPTITFPDRGHHCPGIGAKLYGLMTETNNVRTTCQKSLTSCPPKSGTAGYRRLTVDCGAENVCPVIKLSKHQLTPTDPRDAASRQIDIRAVYSWMPSVINSQRRRVVDSSLLITLDTSTIVTRCSQQ